MRALFLAAALFVTACDSQPPPKTANEIDQIVSIAEKAIGAAQKVSTQAPTADVHEAMRELIAAFAAARKQIDEIMAQLATAKYLGRGSIDPINMSACVQQHISHLPSIELMDDNLLGAWVFNAHQCAINAGVYFGALPREDAAAAALAVSVIYPIGLIANVQLGLPGRPWVQEYISTNEAIAAKMGPGCNTSSSETERVRHECAAYEVALAIRPKLEALAKQLPPTP